MYSPKMAVVSRSSDSIGVPVKPMNAALGRASRRLRARPSIRSYWVRCASSAITTMLRRSDSNGNVRLASRSGLGATELLHGREHDPA